MHLVGWFIWITILHYVISQTYANLKNEWSCTSIPLIILHGVDTGKTLPIFLLYLITWEELFVLERWLFLMFSLTATSVLPPVRNVNCEFIVAQEPNLSCCPNNQHFLPTITILCLFLSALWCGGARLLQLNVRAQPQLFTLHFKNIIV
jgi:hypothetical protein